MEKYQAKQLQIETDDVPKMPPSPDNSIRVVRMTVDQAQQRYPDLLGDLNQMMWIGEGSEEEMSETLDSDVEIVLDYDKNRIEVWLLMPDL